MNFRLKLIALGLTAGALSSIPSTSQADVIHTFDLSGEFVLPTQAGYQNYRPLNGSVTIDTTTGLILSQTSFSPIDPSLPITLTQGETSNKLAYALNVNGQIFRSVIYFNTPTLVNYTGGNLGSQATPAGGGLLSSFDAQLLPPGIVLSYGTATAEPVLEPGSMPLLAAGFGSLALAGFFRQRRD